MKMNIRIKILSVFIPLCLFLCFMSNTYSRYVADTTGNLKMSFAQWQILVNNEDIINNSSSSIVFARVFKIIPWPQPGQNLEAPDAAFCDLAKSGFTSRVVIILFFLLIYILFFKDFSLRLK